MVEGKVAAVMDFVNNAQTSTLAFGLLRKGGKVVVQVGLYGGEMAAPLYTLADLGCPSLVVSLARLMTCGMCFLWPLRAS